MPYRAKETIHTDVNPLADEFNGQLLSEDEGSFLLIGKGGILSDADAEKYGLTKSDKVEQIEDGQAEREQDERNLATIGAQAQAQAADSGNAKPAKAEAKAADTTTANADADDTGKAADTGTSAKAPQTTKGRKASK